MHVPLDDQEEVPQEVQNKGKWKKRLFGLAIVFGIVVSWVGSGEFANYFEQNMDYQKIFLIVYVLDVWNILILPFFCIYSWIVSLVKNRECINPFHTISKDLKKDKIGTGKIIVTALVSTFNQVIADYGYFRALAITSTSSGIVLFNLSSVIAYVLSLFILREKFSVIKALSVLLAFGGAAAITFSDQSSSNTPPGVTQPWIGDVVMAGAALFWALYLVCYKRFVGDPSFGTINLQGTLMGIFNTFLLWPVIIILHYTHVESFELPTGDTLKFILITTGLAFINNYLFTFGTAVTSPVFVLIGGMLAIPGSAIIDWLFRGGKMTILKIVGTVIVAIAFLLINLELDAILLYLKEKLCGLPPSHEYMVVDTEEQDEPLT